MLGEHRFQFRLLAAQVKPLLFVVGVSIDIKVMQYQVKPVNTREREAFGRGIG